MLSYLLKTYLLEIGISVRLVRRGVGALPKYRERLWANSSRASTRLGAGLLFVIWFRYILYLKIYRPS
jgi:hypothetical protein